MSTHAQDLEAGRTAVPTPETKTLSASELLKEWKEMHTERTVIIRKRQMFSGPPGIEESVSTAHSDIGNVMWFIDKTLKLLAQQEKTQ